MCVFILFHSHEPNVSSIGLLVLMVLSEIIFPQKKIVGSTYESYLSLWLTLMKSGMDYSSQTLEHGLSLFNVKDICLGKYSTYRGLGCYPISSIRVTFAYE